jgi:hypothetical protein
METTLPNNETPATPPSTPSERPKRLIDRLNRFQAAGIHLAISCVIAIVLVVLMWWVWYPGPLFSAMGGGKLLLLIVGIDVVMGPLITLVIFNPKKKSLRMDLSIIALLQVAAFFYGASIMFISRPVYITFAGDRFDVMSESRMVKSELHLVTNPEFKSIPLWGPKYAAFKKPDSIEENNRILVHPQAPADLGAFAQHLVVYDEMAKVAATKGKPLAALRRKDEASGPALDAFLKKNGLEESKVVYVPVVTRATDLVAILDSTSGKLHGLVVANPW